MIIDHDILWILNVRKCFISNCLWYTYFLLLSCIFVDFQLSAGICTATKWYQPTKESSKGPHIYKCVVVSLLLWYYWTNLLWLIKFCGTISIGLEYLRLIQFSKEFGQHLKTLRKHHVWLWTYITISIKIKLSNAVFLFLQAGQLVYRKCVSITCPFCYIKIIHQNKKLSLKVTVYSTSIIICGNELFTHIRQRRV